MFGNSSFDHVRQIFADQFTRDAHGYVYRKSQKGAQFRISKVERDDFIATFNRRIRYSNVAMVAATVLLILLLAWQISDSESYEATIALWIGLGAIIVPFVAFYYWSWNAPARELQCRTPVSAALNANEARALGFSKISYGQLGLAAVMGVGLVWKQSLKTDVLHGWGLIWLIAGVSLVLLAAVQTFRKWRYHQGQEGCH